MLFIGSYAHLDCAGKGDIFREFKWLRWSEFPEVGLDTSGRGAEVREAGERAGKDHPALAS
jgi:hypothetical protein